MIVNGLITWFYISFITIQKQVVSGEEHLPAF